ncbi:hypothetical protein PPACK8108_LOCUS9930, partial [Phakopsora pachyrhizi]
MVLLTKENEMKGGRWRAGLAAGQVGLVLAAGNLAGLAGLVQVEIEFVSKIDFAKNSMRRGGGQVTGLAGLG